MHASARAPQPQWAAALRCRRRRHWAALIRSERNVAPFTHSLGRVQARWARLQSAPLAKGGRACALGQLGPPAGLWSPASCGMASSNALTARTGAILGAGSRPALPPPPPPPGRRQRAAPRRRSQPCAAAADAGAGAQATPAVAAPAPVAPTPLRFSGEALESHKQINQRLCGAETVEELLALLGQEGAMAGFNLVNATTAFHRLAKVGWVCWWRRAGCRGAAAVEIAAAAAAATATAQLCLLLPWLALMPALRPPPLLHFLPRSARRGWTASSGRRCARTRRCCSWGQGWRGRCLP